MLVQHLLERSAARTPTAVAIVETTRSITYGELEGAANRFANVLLGFGVQPGDRVILAIENTIELVAAYFGTLKAGAVAVPLPPGGRSDRLVRAVADCSPSACLMETQAARELLDTPSAAGIRGLLTHSRNKRLAARAADPDGRTVDLAAALDAASPARPATSVIDLDLAAIIYTSGSTGAPRGVMLRHRNIAANTASIVSYLELTSSDRVMCVLPLYYVYGLSLLHTHISVAGSVVLDNRFTYPNVVLAAMREHRVTGFAGVPSTFALLLHRSNLTEMAFPDLRYVTQAGGGMPPARLQEWLASGPQVPFYVMYGATEASARLTYLPPAELPRKLGSIGKAIPNTEISVLLEDGRDAAPGEVGELVARGANISPGYWNSPEDTAERFPNGCYRTGDLGYADEEGFLFLVGRRHDMIKVGAHRVGPSEIEDVLHEHPDIQEAAVVSAPHEILGEVPVAFVTSRQRAAIDAEGIRAFCASRLAPHKVPARVFTLDEMPRTGGAGKTDKLLLRTRAAATVEENTALG